ALSDLLDQGRSYLHGTNELRADIKRIQAIQQEVIVLTELFRSAHSTAFSEFRMMIDAGSENFALPRAYDSIKEKLQHSHALVSAKLSEIRNNYVDFIQLAAFGVAATAASLYILNPLILTGLNWLTQLMGGKGMQDISKFAPEHMGRNALLNFC